MQIESFRQFVRLAEEGSFYRAAKACYMSQQGLNRAISSMESELGVKLLQRSRSGVSLTSQGERFVQYAREFLKDYDAMAEALLKAEVEQGDSTRPLTVRATYHPVILMQNIHPELSSGKDVIVSQNLFDDVIERACLSDGDELFLVDIFQRSEGKLKEYPQLKFEPLFTTSCGILHSDGLFPQGGGLHRAELEDVSVTYDSTPEIEKLLEWLFRSHSLKRTDHRVMFPSAAFDFVRASEDSAVFFSSAFYAVLKNNPDFNTEGTRFTPFVTPESIITVGMLYNKEKPPCARARHEASKLRRRLGGLHS